MTVPLSTDESEFLVLLHGLIARSPTNPNQGVLLLSNQIPNHNFEHGEHLVCDLLCEVICILLQLSLYLKAFSG